MSLDMTEMDRSCVCVRIVYAIEGNNNNNKKKLTSAVAGGI